MEVASLTLRVFDCGFQNVEENKMDSTDYAAQHGISCRRETEEARSLPRGPGLESADGRPYPARTPGPSGMLSKPGSPTRAARCGQGALPAHPLPTSTHTDPVNHRQQASGRGTREGGGSSKSPEF